MRHEEEAAIEDVLRFYARTKITFEAALDDVDIAELLYLQQVRDGQLVAGGVQLEYLEGIERLEVATPVRSRLRVAELGRAPLGFRRLAELPTSTDEELLDYLASTPEARARRPSYFLRRRLPSRR